LLTIDQIYQLVLASTPPTEYGLDFENDLKELKLAGRFSAGAKILLNRMQANPNTPAATVLEHATELSLRTYELRPIMLASFLISADVSFKPGLRSTFATIPSPETVSKNFADQRVDPKSVRQEVIARVLDRFDLDRDVSKIIRKPRLLLAFDELNVTEFFAAYFAICIKMASNRSPGVYELTVLVPDTVMTALAEPESRDALERGLYFLLGDYD
jgi:hypothetical protein